LRRRGRTTPAAWRALVAVAITFVGTTGLGLGIETARTSGAPRLAARVMPADAVPDADARDDLRPGRRRPASLATASSPTPFETLTSARHPDGFTPTALVQVLAFQDVISATTLYADTLGLTGSRHADGRPIDVLRPGNRIPVSVAAIEPSGFIAVAGPSHPDAHVLRELGPGEIILSATSAQLRRAQPGDRIDLLGLEDLVVSGIVADDLARGSELLVHIAHAGALGMQDRASLVLRHLVRDDADVEQLRAALVALDEEADIRVWSGGHRVPLVLTMTELKLRFGEFSYRFVPNQREVVIDPTYVAANIVTQRVPILGNVSCHRAIMDDLRAALDAVVAAGLAEHVVPRAYGGCFMPRRIATGRPTLSRHSWGIAIDLNVDFRLPGAGPVPPDEFIAIFADHGFRWGGDFTTPDNHHYEWVGHDLARQRPSVPAARTAVVAASPRATDGSREAGP
jgi:hypothetical protein